jgi:peroxiredoxin
MAWLLVSLLSAALAAPTPGPSMHLGDEARAFSLPSVNEQAALRAVANTHVSLSAMVGPVPAFPAKVVVLHFMERRGGETQLAMLQRLHRRHHGAGAAFVAVMAKGGDIAGLSAWVSGQHLDVPVLNDAYSIVIDRYGVTRFPMTFVIDAEGVVQAIGMPGEDLEAQVEAVIAPYVGGSKG